MTIDLTAMSKRELKKLLREIDTAIADFDQRGKRQVLAEIEAHASSRAAVACLYIFGSFITMACMTTV